MRGRGASSGISNKGKLYGSEYITVYQSGNIKYVEVNGGASTAPMETMSKDRIYVTIDKNTQELKYVSFYDSSNKRYKQIDLQHPHKVDGIKEQPHVHMGYNHNENGDRKLTKEEQKLIESIKKKWYNKNSK